MRVLSLFSGIGGIDLGLERAGHTIVAQSEIEPYCCRVLAKHWPDVPNLGDVTSIDWESVRDRFAPDLVAGGYPCQPFSLAGSRQGEHDPRHLWPHMLDAIRVLRPRVALLENVPGHLSMGFGRVLGDLAESGYDAEWDCIPAAAFGAPHIRYRVFVVAYAASTGCQTGRPGRLQKKRPTPTDSSLLADADGSARHAPRRSGETIFGPETLERFRRRGGGVGEFWSVEPDICRVAHGGSPSGGPT